MFHSGTNSQRRAGKWSYPGRFRPQPEQQPWLPFRADTDTTSASRAPSYHSARPFTILVVLTKRHFREHVAECLSPTQPPKQFFAAAAFTRT